MADTSRTSRGCLAAVIVLVLLAIGACAPEETANSGSSGDNSPPSLAANEARMSRAELGDDWPLTTEEGIVSCEGAGEVYFTTNGTHYAVNGLANGLDNAPDIEAIWADDPKMKGLKINIGPIIDRGLELCD